MVDYQLLESKAHELVSHKTIIALNEAIASLSTEHFGIVRKFNEIGFLRKIDEQISITEQKFKEAVDFYTDFSKAFANKFSLNLDDISIYPQGSASTKTVIRSATREDFDIDAVAQFAILPATNPMIFFNKIGEVLNEVACRRKDIKIEPKKRCWRVNLLNSGFYIDLIPGVASSHSLNLNETRSYNYSISANTVIYIVDTKEKQWQSSNPKGFTLWLLEANQYSSQLVQYLTFAALGAMDEAIEQVPNQKIQSDDYLLLAVRLLKRHRDIYYRNNGLNQEYKPISVIICTLIGQTVRAMVGNKRHYNSFFEFFYDLVMKLPHMIQLEDGKYLIPNPTAVDENFADRWADSNDNGTIRKDHFYNWTETLIEDMKKVIDRKSQVDSFEAMKEIFGVTNLTYKPESGEFVDQHKQLGLTSTLPKSPSSKVPPDGLA